MLKGINSKNKAQIAALTMGFLNNTSGNTKSRRKGKNGTIKPRNNIFSCADLYLIQLWVKINRIIESKNINRVRITRGLIEPKDG